MQNVGEAFVLVHDQENPLNVDRILVIVSVPRRAYFSNAVREAALGDELLLELLFADEELSTVAFHALLLVCFPFLCLTLVVVCVSTATAFSTILLVSM